MARDPRSQPDRGAGRNLIDWEKQPFYLDTWIGKDDRHVTWIVMNHDLERTRYSDRLQSDMPGKWNLSRLGAGDANPASVGECESAALAMKAAETMARSEASEQS